MGIESFGVNLETQCSKLIHGQFFNSAHQKIVDVVANFVNGPSCQVVRTNHTELVLNFVVEVAELTNIRPSTHQSVDP